MFLVKLREVPDGLFGKIIKPYPWKEINIESKTIKLPYVKKEKRALYSDASKATDFEVDLANALKNIEWIKEIKSIRDEGL